MVFYAALAYKHELQCLACRKKAARRQAAGGMKQRFFLQIASAPLEPTMLATVRFLLYHRPMGGNDAD